MQGYQVYGRAARGFGARNPKTIAVAVAGFIAGMMTLPHDGEYAKKLLEKLNELAHRCPQAAMVFIAMVAAKLVMDAGMMVGKVFCGRRENNMSYLLPPTMGQPTQDSRLLGLGNK